MGIKNRLKSAVAVLALIVLTPLAVFYLFIFPALVANQTFEPGVLSIGFGLFLYLQLWMLIAEYAFEAASQLYGFRRKRLLGFLTLGTDRRDRSSQKETDGKGLIEGALVAPFLSFAFTIYGFALAYVFLSHSKPQSFNVGKLDLFSAVYFSLTTIATVGFGDIVPASKIARLLTMFEIAFGILYVTFFFSIIAGFIRQKTSKL